MSTGDAKEKALLDYLMAADDDALAREAEQIMLDLDEITDRLRGHLARLEKRQRG